MTQTIRALLVEDNRIEARQAQHWLAAKKEPVIQVEWVERLATGLERLTSGGIDVVLLDLNLPDSRGLETFRALHTSFPDIPVIVLTGEHDESMGISAVEQGAADYLVKQDVDGAKLAKIVHFSIARHKAQVEQITRELRGTAGRVISFLGAKGGVGTTTTAANVAVALAAQGKSVILAELKPVFGGLSFSLHGDPTAGLGSLLDMPPARFSDRDLAAALSRGPATSRVLFGIHDAERVAELDAERADLIIKGLARMAEFVILDLPSWPSAVTATAALQSEYVALVTEREPLAVRCGQAAVTQLKDWGVEERRIGAVVVGRSTLPLAMDLPTIRSLIGCGILRIVPLAAGACYKAYVDRVPLVLSQPDNEAAEVYLDIARTLAESRGFRTEAA